MDQKIKIEDVTLLRVIEELLSNAIDAKAKNIYVELNVSKDGLINIEVQDDGEVIGNVDTFLNEGVSYKNSSGMGLYLIKEFCLKRSGDVTINRLDTTNVNLYYQNSFSLDKLNGLEDILYGISITEANIIFKFTLLDYSFTYNSKQIKDILNGVSIKELQVMNFIKEYIREGLKQK